MRSLTPPRKEIIKLRFVRPRDRDWSFSSERQFAIEFCPECATELRAGRSSLRPACRRQLPGDLLLAGDLESLRAGRSFRAAARDRELPDAFEAGAAEKRVRIGLLPDPARAARPGGGESGRALRGMARGRFRFCGGGGRRGGNARAASPRARHRPAAPRQLRGISPATQPARARSAVVRLAAFPSRRRRLSVSCARQQTVLPVFRFSIHS
jgi:hypothetical protein